MLVLEHTKESGEASHTQTSGFLGLHGFRNHHNRLRDSNDVVGKRTDAFFPATVHAASHTVTHLDRCAGIWCLLHDGADKVRANCRARTAHVVQVLPVRRVQSIRQNLDFDRARGELGHIHLLDGSVRNTLRDNGVHAHDAVDEAKEHGPAVIYLCPSPVEDSRSFRRSIVSKSSAEKCTPRMFP